MQKERDSINKRAEELQKQLNVLYLDHEKIRRAHALDLQKKVCCAWAIIIIASMHCLDSKTYVMYSNSCCTANCCVPCMQMDFIEELKGRELQKGEQCKATEKSLKEKEREYFALEVGGSA